MRKNSIEFFHIPIKMFYNLQSFLFMLIPFYIPRKNSNMLFTKALRELDRTKKCKEL